MVGIFSLYAYPHKSRPFYSVCDDRASNFHRQFNSCLRGMLSVCISAMLSFGRTLVQEDLIRKILVSAPIWMALKCHFRSNAGRGILQVGLFHQLPSE